MGDQREPKPSFRLPNTRPITARLNEMAITVRHFPDFSSNSASQQQNELLRLFRKLYSVAARKEI
jgi:hypothetical protein